MAGRKPVPDALKLLRGNPGKRPISKRTPNPRRIEPPMPSFLDKDARREWRRVAPVLVRLGVLTEADGMVFAGYCELVSGLAQVNRALKKCKNKMLTEKITVDMDGGSHVEVKQNPLMVMKRQLLQQIRPYCTEFGMTPSSRAKIQVSGLEVVDPQEDFLNGR